MVDKLDIQSGLARRVLYETKFMHSTDEIMEILDKVEIFIFLLLTPDYKTALSKTRIKLKQAKDIRGTLKRLKNRDVLDDIELFEIKTFALLCREIHIILAEKNITVVPIPSLEAVINILDPDKKRIANFYIYDSYSMELAELRRQLKVMKESKDATEAYERDYQRSIDVEDTIRKELSTKLYEYHQIISRTLLMIAELDILIAKARQATEMRLSKPHLSTTGNLSYEDLFNPEIEAALHMQQKEYQPIDVTVERGGTLITGANMTGKSVILKTVALAQALFQFGFFVPAGLASLTTVDEILICMGDDQNELSGLSSFAAEMIKINRIIEKAKNRENILVLIDELARSTNPSEGRAIVNAVLEILKEYNVLALLTTHYTVTASCRRFRVKGLLEGYDSAQLTVDNIDKYIDYRLVYESGDTVPHEALKIARVLGVDLEVLKKAEYYLYNK
ncbi:DNA mismatch repair protein MutS [Bacteroides sp. 214]|nr:DNA mismatch repair protein MutS [Bacteroides sp. 214]